jgi:tetratricopeptide (TPR) repeat protein
VTVGFVVGPPITPWSWGYWPYYNPYCVAPVVVEGATIDYSQPLVLATVPTTAPQAPADPAQADTGTATSKEQAMEMLNGARETFIQGDYAKSLSQCNQAIAKLPNDPVLHEFRALMQFALRQYKEAAGTAYAVLSVGPGWDWATLSGFYPRVDVYAEQLRALEEYVRANPNQPEARFLLAYHYLACGHNDTAAEQFKAAVKLNPSDRLSAQLATSLSPTSPTSSPEPPAPSAESAVSASAVPVTAAALTGEWKVVRDDGATITLNLKADATYTWKFVQKDKTQEFSGAYSVADNLLILKENNSPVMVGEVKILADNRFNFRLPGSVANDPGLTFGK